MAQERRRQANIYFPMAGLVARYGFQHQPPFSCADNLNVRPESVHQGTGATHIKGRERGGTRPGLAKFFDQELGSGSPVKMMATVTYYSSGLKSRMVAISSGELYFEAVVGTLSLADTTGGVFNPDRVIHSAEHNQILYIADHAISTTDSAGTYKPKKFTPASNDIADWTASNGGTIPTGCECIALWRDRIILGGGTTTPHGLFMSRAGDPLDWDYSLDDASAAVSMVLSDAGTVGDVVTALSPHADNCMIIGCASSLWILRGDPGFGGSLEVLSQTLGVIDKGSWCVTPEGLFVFLSQDGIYMVPAQCEAARHPQSLSRERLPRELLGVDKSVTNVVMCYDLIDRGIHIYLTPITGPGSASTHWWFDWESKSFWKVQHGSEDFEPFTLHQRKNFYDDNSTVAIGCRDGYIRRHTSDASDDDGTDFDSNVIIGPLGDPTMSNDTTVAEIQATLAANSGDVLWELRPGDDPTSALTADPQYTSVWKAGRNRPEHPRVRGQSIYLYLENGEEGVPWAWEAGTMILAKQGKTRT